MAERAVALGIETEDFFGFASGKDGDVRMAPMIDRAMAN